MLFKHLDIKNRGYISKARLSEYMIDKANYFATERELSHIALRFDRQ
jgi:Ca2+-binding EF-hand superfamily protein